MNSTILTPIGIRSLSIDAQKMLSELSKNNEATSSFYSQRYHQNRLNDKNTGKKLNFYSKKPLFQNHQSQVLLK